MINIIYWILGISGALAFISFLIYTIHPYGRINRFVSTLLAISLFFFLWCLALLIANQYKPGIIPE